MADRHKVLVIDNDPGIRRYIRRILGSCGCEVTAGRAEILSDTIATWQPDCIVLGLDAVPDSGKTLAQLTQSEPRAPLLCLVADRNPQALLAAVEAGGDDCLAKPFASNDLELRIRRLLHRKQGKPGRPVRVRLGRLKIDVVLRRATADGLAFRLTRREWDLLQLLFDADGRPVSHSDLLRKLWGPDHRARIDRLRHMVHQLRGKIEVDRARPRYLLSVPRIGYRLAVPAQQSHLATEDHHATRDAGTCKA